MGATATRSLVALGLLLGTVTGAGAATPAKEVEAFKSGVFDPPHAAPGFQLTSATDGTPLSLASFKGKVVILEFGFSTCPQICPFTLGTLARVFEQLGKEAGDVQVVFVTVDPERDTPERLREFLGSFNPTFKGATGTQEELEAVRDAYGVIATREESDDPAIGYQVHHSSSLYLVDRQGLLRALVPFGKSADDIAHDLRILLKK